MMIRDGKPIPILFSWYALILASGKFKSASFPKQGPSVITLFNGQKVTPQAKVEAKP